MSSYRISQLAERAGVPATTLRYYELQGLLPARRTAAGHRHYDDSALPRLEFIAAAKHLGLTLADIRTLLPHWESGTCADVRDQLRPLLHTHLAETQLCQQELATTADRLRTALTTLDSPAQDGPCTPGCGLLPAPPPIACTLSAARMSERENAWRTLLAGARREELPEGLRLHLPAGKAAEVAELAVAEQECCAYLGFTLELTAAEIRLDIRAPAEALPLLPQTFG